MGNSAAQQQKNLLNTQAGTEYNEAQSLLPQAESGWQSVMAPLTPTDQSAVRNAGEGAVASSYGGSMADVQHRAGASNNPVGVLDLEDTLARQKAAGVSSAATADQANIDAQNLQRMEAGTAGLSGLESGLSSSANSLYGSSTSAANAQQQSAFNWGNFLDSLVGGAATVTAAKLGS